MSNQKAPKEPTEKQKIGKIGEDCACEYLQKTGYKCLQIFRPSFIAGHRKESRPGERIGLAIFSFLSPLFIGPLKKYAPIPAEHIARAMYRAAQKKNAGTFIYDSAESDAMGKSI